jgi:hypothetical protein
MDGQKTKLVARTEARLMPRQGEHVKLRPRPGEAHRFDAETGDRLS